MAWHRSGDKPLSGLVMVRLPTHICVTRTQWVSNKTIFVGFQFAFQRMYFIAMPPRFNVDCRKIASNSHNLVGGGWKWMKRENNYVVCTAPTNGLDPLFRRKGTVTSTAICRDMCFFKQHTCSISANYQNMHNDRQSNGLITQSNVFFDLRVQWNKYLFSIL